MVVCRRRMQFLSEYLRIVFMQASCCHINGASFRFILCVPVDRENDNQRQGDSSWRRHLALKC
ncbi:hypothetical protein HETIRDRAFT_437092 [Heterobasidion irregulare TC 32-1]|uniref:Uncharacterized protein n=1 Tax=Heterobasidion irregulare (strain TC 32-1) TaxID=747525 RepID=W4JP51_HETIT|nr:uncharacterized protein HETIRDRAFT_437092 [Heterobasidion irregulare TC 32-1]ETW75303.1 hypothetical protein HETIRDRAFT_437092 [Heterobasidion irregulare TC 32-1]